MSKIIEAAQVLMYNFIEQFDLLLLTHHTHLVHDLLELQWVFY